MYNLMNLIQQKNSGSSIIVAGEIVSDFHFHHISQGIRYYKGYVSSVRLSGKPDTLPVLVPDGMLDFSTPYLYNRVIIYGEIQVFKNHVSNMRRNSYYIYAHHAEYNEIDGPTYENTVYLDGRIRHKPIYRKTPNGKEITNITISTIDAAGRFHDIPCIFWGKNAQVASTLEIGTHLHVWARFESRKYQKRLPDKTITRTTYEASVQNFSIIHDALIL